MQVPITSIFYVKAPIEPERIIAIDIPSPIQINFETNIKNYL
jgi:hypothetical protein